MTLFWMFLGFLLLVLGGEFIVRASIAISLKFNISKVVIGMTVVAFATSLPELLVSLKAAVNGSSSIAINNVIGSNIANIGMVLGLTAIIGNIPVVKSFYRLDWPVMMFFSLMLYFFLYNDNLLSSFEGLILFTSLIIFLFFVVRYNAEDLSAADAIDESLNKTSGFKILIWIIFASFSLYYGAEWLVSSAIDLAKSIGVSEAVISVSVIAIGTSIPELATSVIAIAKNEKGISIGNLIGSNIFNIGSVLGLTTIIKPILITDSNILDRDIVWMLVFAFLVLILSLFPKKNNITKTKGFLLVVLYSGFILSTYLK
ncbi:calcium/sodium antiporter [Flavobacteriaceae bacterium]|jgi:cation:H+ antiporter|nr:calcium/sodium antiporter [Flavobacteriales bacterium]MBL6877674.1 calcium/sodium antiporter [Flavobacteriaceae bacterium]MDA9550742.1 calcium/sodium antiporter [Flavobacteriaceae bacterium]MDB2599485.1 calcium/sodium antiporter [Flavobacteriaceae bacterium]MDG1681569.1 calcium/sodium antiporter [Flavobacteriaceae bacterium]